MRPTYILTTLFKNINEIIILKRIDFILKFNLQC